MECNVEDETEELEILPLLYCTVCYHDLNDPIFFVCSHPLLNVAVCLRCFDDIAELREFDGEDSQESSDRCDWCLQPGNGELFICGAGDQCPHSFCPDCLRSNLGDDFMVKLDSTDLWQCLFCDPISLLPLQEAKNSGVQRSTFKNVQDIAQTIESLSEENLDYLLNVLGKCVEEIKDAQSHMELSHLLDVEAEIRTEKHEELASKTKSTVSELVKEERNLYERTWKQHEAIMLHQEAFLTELLEHYDYDPRSFPFYRDFLDQKLGLLEQQLYSIPDETFLTVRRSILRENISNIDKTFVEEVTEERRENLDGLIQLAANNDIVSRYANNPPLDPLLYPQSFHNIVPTNVLKALYLTIENCQQDEVEELCEAFSIPRFVYLIIFHASRELPDSCWHWPISRTTHPAVLKALYFARNRMEYFILSEHYNLDPELSDWIDFGESSSLFEIVKDRKQFEKNPEKFTLREMKDAQLTEDRQLVHQLRTGGAVNRIESALELKIRLDEHDADRSMKHRQKYLSRTYNLADLSNRSRSGCSSTSDLRGSTTVGMDVIQMHNQGEGKDEGHVDEPANATMDIDTVESVDDNAPAAMQVMDLTELYEKKDELERRESVTDQDVMEESPLADHSPKDTKCPPQLSRPERAKNEDITPITKRTSNNESISNGKRNRDSEVASKSNKQTPIVIDLTEETNSVSSWLIEDDKSPNSLKRLRRVGSDQTKVNKSLFMTPMPGKDQSTTARSSSSESIEPSRQKQLAKSSSIDSLDSEEWENLIFGAPDRKGKNSKRRSKSGALSQETRAASKDERMRRNELKGYHRFREDDAEGIVVNTVRPPEDAKVMLIKEFTAHLKTHQIEGIRFLWTNVVGSVKLLSQNDKGGGCILAHCMGLGKTFTVIAFVMTMLANPVIRSVKVDMEHIDTMPATKSTPSNLLGFNSSSSAMNASVTQQNKPVDGQQSAQLPSKRPRLYRVLIVGPKNTLENWFEEFRNWTPEDVLQQFHLFLVDSKMNAKQRLDAIKEWFKDGGIVIMSYEMFILLTKDGGSSKIYSAEFKSLLINIGPDLVICDEAHRIKNLNTKGNKQLNALRTKRRVALTGSPLQNNLIEYWCMVNWVREYFLFTQKEFRQRFVEPIKKGEYKDADSFAKMTMKKRSHVLHKKLESIVNRKDITELQHVLQPKREFIMLVRITPFQKYLYKLYLAKLSTVKKGMLLFRSYQSLLRIWNHPAITVMHSIQRQEAAQSGSKKIAPISLNRICQEVAGAFQTSKNLLDTTALDAAAGLVEQRMLDDREAVRSRSQSTEDVEEQVEEDYRSDDMDGFVVPDDYVEYDDDDEESNYQPESSDDEDSLRSQKKRKRRSGKISNYNRQESGYKEASHQSERISSLPLDDEKQVNQGRVMEIKSIDTLPKLSVPLSSGKKKYAPQDGAKVNNDEADEDLEYEIELEDDLSADWWKPDESTTSSNGNIDDRMLISMSSKMIILFNLLAYSVQIGDKMLIFSQSLPTLDLIQKFLAVKWGELIGCSDKRLEQWQLHSQYLRIDGRVSERQRLIKKFNESPKVKLMLISTKAGNMGINLQAANRVVIFDCSWNPVHDIQSIFRSYRFGQTKNVFVYRFVAHGTMEEKIFKKQLLKETLAKRVVDHQMPDNNVANEQEHAQLLVFDEDSQDPYAHMQNIHERLSGGTEDIVLKKFLEKNGTDLLAKIEDRDTIFEDRSEEHLNEDEKKQAEDEYEREISITQSSAVSSSFTAPTAKNQQQTSFAMDARAYAMSIDQTRSATLSRDFNAKAMAATSLLATNKTSLPTVLPQQFLSEAQQRMFGHFPNMLPVNVWNFPQVNAGIGPNVMVPSIQTSRPARSDMQQLSSSSSEMK